MINETWLAVSDTAFEECCYSETVKERLERLKMPIGHQKKSKKKTPGSENSLVYSIKTY